MRDVIYSKTGIGKILRSCTVLLLACVLVLGAAAPLYAAEAGTETTAEPASAGADPSVVPTNGIEGWPQANDIFSDAACLMDADTGTILFDKSMDRQMYPASVTKLMTALLALENGNLEDEVVMTETGTAYCVNDSSNLYTQVGEVFTLEQMLYGVMLKSANDMATQVGEHIGGTLENFIQMMNDRAVSLGCTGSHFENACGMPNDAHMTTAHDLALIAQEALKHEKFREIVNTATYTIPPTNMTSTERSMTNHNALLVVPEFFYPGIIGGKTGYTDAAQSCLSNFASRNAMTLIVITLHAMDGSYAAQDNVDLLDYGYNNFKLVDLGFGEYLTSGGKIMIPSGANAADCTVEVEEYEDAANGKMVNRVYYYSGHRVGNALMTAEQSKAYEKSLVKETEKDKSKAEKNKTKKKSTDSTESADESGKAGTVSNSGENASAGSGSDLEPEEIKAENDDESLRSVFVKIIIGLVIFMIVFVIVMVIALNVIRNKKKISRKRKREAEKTGTKRTGRKSGSNGSGEKGGTNRTNKTRRK